MVFDGLVTELKRLLRERVLGYQAKESVESFGSSVSYSLELNFVSSQRTFGSNMSEEYEDGQTVVCDLEGHDLQVAVMMLPSANDWVLERNKGEKFELTGRLLSYDTLYDRAIFGQTKMTEEDVAEQPPPVSEQVPVQPETELVEKPPSVQPHEVIKRAVRRNSRMKLPKKAKIRKPPKQRRLYGKSKDVASPKRNKKTFCFKPRKLRIAKRPGPSSKRKGHAIPFRKPLKRTLKTVPKVNLRRSVQRGQPVQAPKFRVSNSAVPMPPPNPADIVRILQKKRSRGYAALTEEEHQSLRNAGLGCSVEDDLENSKGCRRLIAILMLVISLPFLFSSNNKFGFCLLIFAILLTVPDFVKVFKN
jgi:hypothetical protein